jgi:hypothetical protein
MRSICFLLLIHSLAAGAAFHAVSGVVTDSSGAAVPGVSVSLAARSGAEKAHTKTDPAGRFKLSLIPAGSYEITAASAGFAAQTRPVKIANTDVQVTITLAVASQKYSITVDSSSAQLDTSFESRKDSLVLEPETFGNLPIKDGDILSALSSFVNPAGGAAPTIIVDGMERDDADLSLSSIQQVRINNNAYSAEFPKPGKDRIEIETRGGTDEFHGDATVRARNSVFDARNPMAPDKLPFSREGYELDVSGPILRHRLSFFLDADREQQQQSQPVFAILPSGVLQTDVLSPVNRNRFLGRLDWQGTQSNRLSVKYELHIDRSANNGIGGFSLPSLATTLFHHDYRIELSDQQVFTRDLVNSFRIAAGTNYQQVSSANGGPLIVVQGAFSDGGAQVNEWRREPRTDLLDTLAWSKGANSLKFGATANFHPFQTYNADDFGGTYTFASLADYQARQATLFTIAGGNPALQFHQNDYAWFLQYERNIGNLSLFAGVRHEFQSGMPVRGNLAPRLAAAFAPGKRRRTVIRVGAGVFYDRRPPPLLEQSLRFNGIQTQQYILTNPVYPVSDPDGLGSVLPNSVWRIDPSLAFPRIYQASATLERQLPGGFALVSDYTYQRGNHLFRARNLNAPLPETGLLPFPDQGFVDQIESSASSRGQIVNWTLRSPGKRRFQFFAQYTLGWLYDDTGGAFPPPPGASGAGLFAAMLPADNYDLRPEWGRANNDARHRLGLSGTAQLPWQLTFGTMTALRSGLPFNITTGEDNNGDGVANDRPPGVSRNTGQGPGQISVDVHLGRKVTMRLGEHKIDAAMGIDSFNVLNHTNLGNYVGVISSPLFGRANSALDGRQMQFTLQVHF